MKTLSRACRLAAADLALLLAGDLAADSTWQLQSSGTTERFRAVSAVSGTVAWASGSKGSVVRTVDGGAHWAALAVPGSEALDFRDIEAIDDQVAYVLSIGPGDRSRIYKTVDAGKSWTLQFTNPDPKAFYDAIARTSDGGRTWALIGSTRLRGFRSGIVFVPGSGGRQLIAVGPAGTDRSADGGSTWSLLGEVGFHAVSVDRAGKSVWAVGEQGRVGRLVGTPVLVTRGVPARFALRAGGPCESRDGPGISRSRPSCRPSRPEGD